jgi:hypothetical protein
MKYIIALFYYIVPFGFLLYAISKFSKDSRWKQVLSVFSLSLITSVIVVFYSEIVPYKVSDQLSLISDSELITLSDEEAKAKDLANQFTLLNVSKSLDPDSVTNRSDIAYLLKSINDSLSDNLEYLDLVILDIFFQDKNHEDTLLLDQLNKLHAKNKLILAFDESKCLDDRLYKLSNKDAFGSVTYESKDGLFIKNNLIHDVRLENQLIRIPSLPYLAYQKLMNVKSEPVEYNYFLSKLHLEKEIDSNEESALAMSSYTPILFPKINSIRNSESKNDEVLIQDLNSGFNFRVFDFMIKRNQKPNKINVLMIGQFKDVYDDKHQTAYGYVHGITILQSTIINFILGYHKGLFSFFISVFLGFLIIYSYIFYKTIYKPSNHSHAPKFKFRILGVLNEVAEILIFHHFQYWLLFFLYIAIYILHHRIIMVTPLFVGLLLLTAFLKVYAQRESKTNDE